MTQTKKNITLFLVSFLILFLELALIRWISTEIRIFAYLSNLVLLACFIGGGLGCYLSNKKIHLSITAIAVSVLVLCVILPLKITIDNWSLHIFKDIPVFLASFQDSIIHYQWTISNLRVMQVVGMTTTMIMFFIILVSFIPLGQILGRVFDEDKNTIRAYSINVAASVLGIWGYNVLCFMYAPVEIWLLTAVALLSVIMILRSDFKIINIIALVLALGVIAGMFVSSRANKGLLTIWSPYQKLSLEPIVPYNTNIDPFKNKHAPGYVLNVNNVGFMHLNNFKADFKRTHPLYFINSTFYHNSPVGGGVASRYNFPFLVKRDAKTTLILGAGAGNDAAGALRAGLEQVDIVEIDPGIVKLGVDYHPEDPYTNPKVGLYVDDARSFIKRTDKKYDVIFFGLLDAHAQASTMNNMRMDHYVYTIESFQDAKRLLKEDGLMVVGFWFQRIWMGSRIQLMLKEVYGFDPVVVSLNGDKTGLGPVVMLTGHTKEGLLKIIANTSPEVIEIIKENIINYSEDVKITTDDWPYLYLRTPIIPKMHLCVIAALLFIFIASKFIFIRKAMGGINLHFFFLGAAFLLLEFQNINKTSLLFGLTWLVNSINITAILILILLANLLVARTNITSLRIPYILLFISLGLIFVVPLDVFNALGYWPKSILASLFLNLPIFFAGIIFITSFKQAPHKNAAFGSNLLGAVAGGLMEAVSFVVGIRMLILLTAALYGLSLLALKFSFRNAKIK